MCIDWTTTRDWRDTLLRDDLDEVSRTVAEQGVNPPEFIWNPDGEEVRSPQNRFLLDFWRIHGDGGTPPATLIDPLRLRPAIGYITVAEPLDDSCDFVFRLFGSTVASLSGFDMTQERLSRHPAPKPVVQALLAAFQASRYRRLPMLLSNSPISSPYPARWERLILPFLGEDGRVSRILMGSVPFNAGGVVLGR